MTTCLHVPLLFQAYYQRRFEEIVFGDIHNADINKISSLLKKGVDTNVYNKVAQPQRSIVSINSFYHLSLDFDPRTVGILFTLRATLRGVTLWSCYYNMVL